MSNHPPDPPAPPSRTTDRDDERLLERLRRNDRDAIAALYDQYGRLAYGLACRIVGEPGEAEDVVQESFLALWRQAGKLDSERGSVKSFLLTIVRRRAIDVLRRRTARPERALEMAAPLPAPTPDPVDSVTRIEEREQVVRALQLLPDEQRQAVELTYFQGLTIVEMAEEQRIPLGTAKSRLRLALDRMRKTFAETGTA